jgi:23S rRNA-/tRNA-specific pseudouridylate synthase
MSDAATPPPAATVPTILDAEDGLLIVDKPSGWVVHDAGGDAPDVVGWLTREAGLEGVAPVHRIDRGTSGVVLLSQDPAVRAKVSAWLADGQVHKEYLALVYGRPRRKGIIRRPLDDGPGPPSDAVTRYRTLKWLGRVSLVRVRPESGRKHQIRRHLHGLGHPVVGDDRYLPEQRLNVKGFPGRLWLHAHRVRLPDGREFVSPLPPELVAHLAELDFHWREPAPATSDED